MRLASHLHRILTSICIFALLWGCTAWEPSWPQAPWPVAAGDSSGLLGRAEAGLEAAMDACRAVLVRDPGNYRALCILSNQYILLGAAYTRQRAAKAACYREARRFSELAMYTQPAFRVRVDRGQLPWEAAEALAAEQKEAMLFWVTAVLYEFKEVMGLPAKILNLRWMDRAAVFLQRLEAVAPGWGGGSVELSWSIYYYVLPSMRGGDRQKAATYLERAVGAEGNWLLPRWGRAKYFRVAQGDRDGFRRDLEWVLATGSEAGDPYPWRVFFQQDARHMLMHIDDFF